MDDETRHSARSFGIDPYDATAHSQVMISPPDHSLGRVHRFNA
jgi:hypothetical protein